MRKATAGRHWPRSRPTPSLTSPPDPLTSTRRRHPSRHFQPHSRQHPRHAPGHGEPTAAWRVPADFCAAAHPTPRARLQRPYRRFFRAPGARPFAVAPASVCVGAGRKRLANCATITTVTSSRRASAQRTRKECTYDSEMRPWHWPCWGWHHWWRQRTYLGPITDLGLFMRVIRMIFITRVTSWASLRTGSPCVPAAGATDITSEPRKN